MKGYWSLWVPATVVYSYIPLRIPMRIRLCFLIVARGSKKGEAGRSRGQDVKKRHTTLYTFAMDYSPASHPRTHNQAKRMAPLEPLHMVRVILRSPFKHLIARV